MIKKPAWCKDAVPTTRGWTDASSGELLKAQKFTQEQINEYNGVTEMSTESVSLNEAPPTKSIDDMTKRELKELADHHGVDTKASENKASLMDKVRSFITG